MASEETETEREREPASQPARQTEAEIEQREAG